MFGLWTFNYELEGALLHKSEKFVDYSQSLFFLSNDAFALRHSDLRHFV